MVSDSKSSSPFPTSLTPQTNFSIDIKFTETGFTTTANGVSLPFFSHYTPLELFSTVRVFGRDHAKFTKVTFLRPMGLTMYDLPTPAPADCNDLDSYCGYYVNNLGCDDEWVKLNCANTCNIC